MKTKDKILIKVRKIDEIDMGNPDLSLSHTDTNERTRTHTRTRTRTTYSCIQSHNEFIIFLPKFPLVETFQTDDTFWDKYFIHCLKSSVVCVFLVHSKYLRLAAT